ncbi:HlyD family efflux transporter periplasmic adaptor subunit [Pedobacter aquatilis]|uniref:HlyD family efflux transporter periplasmic adaptor subunit n=1 Tax=Pedobacter aquatilis TaxID=351343 RepID=UPI00292F1324|nr:HlyD family efflux transporter periplasmic adaptor subunit [Pedobacter aquatilis]
MNKSLNTIFTGLAALIMLSSCGNNADPTAVEDTPSPVTPVQVTHVGDSSLHETIELSAVSAYLKKSFVKANMNGYIEKASVQVGQKVGNGQNLFSLITKEARSIGNTVNKLDPGFKFSGVSSIKAEQGGVIVQVNHQKGDYVQDGEALATISDRNSLVFLLDVPYEFHQLTTSNAKVNVELPDGSTLDGFISGTMPAVDSLAQTERVIIKVAAGKDIPEGLIAKVKLNKLNHTNAQVLPKSAVLSNETEDEFWVMKLVNDSTAVKVKVKKGIETGNLTEVLIPKFSKTDRIITSGNYGIADTARVKIQK